MIQIKLSLLFLHRLSKALVQLLTLYLILVFVCLLDESCHNYNEDNWE